MGWGHYIEGSSNDNISVIPWVFDRRFELTEVNTAQTLVTIAWNFLEFEKVITVEVQRSIEAIHVRLPT